MGEIVRITKANGNSLQEDPMEQAVIPDEIEPGVPCSQAVVPTVDIYTARILFDITQKMVEQTVDRRVSLLEKRIIERDKDIMRAIRKIQARTMLTEKQVKIPWWHKLFKKGKY